MKIYFNTLFLFLFIQTISAQNIEEQILISNRQRLTEKDSITYYWLKQQMARYVNPQPDSALYFIQKLKDFSIAKKYSIGLADSDYLMANYFRRMQRYDSAVVYFEKLLEKSKKINYRKGIAISYNGICHVKYVQGKTDQAINACLKCVDIAKDIQDPSTLADTYIAIGNAYVRKNILKKALKFYIRADSLHTVKPLRPIIIAAAYQSIGDVYLQLKEYDKSEEYFIKANNQFRKLPQGAIFFLNTTNWHLGEVYFHKNQLKKADSLLQKAYVFFNTIKDNSTLAQISTYIGQIKARQNQLQEAEKYLLQGYSLLKKNKDLYAASQASIELGNLYLKWNRPNKAILYFKKALQLNKTEKNTLIQQKSYNNLSKVYAKVHDYKNAHIYLKKATKLKDSLNQVQNAAKIRELEAIYQAEKKEKEIALLTSKNKIIAQQKRNQNNIYLTVIGFITLLAIFLFVLLKNRQKTTKKLQELDKAKSNFFANISHEFRTPLTLILSPVNAQLKKNNLTREDHNLFQIIKQNAERLLDLINQVLDISKLDAGKKQIKVSLVKLQDFISYIVYNFDSLAESNKITFLAEINCIDKQGWIDKDVLQKIVNNLLSNSFKYTDTNEGKIIVKVLCDNYFLTIEIKNTGRELSQHDLNKIFERFYQKDYHSEGVGLGLSIVKKMVELHKGSINVQSKDGWTFFTVKIPISKNNYKTDEIIIDKELEIKKKHSAVTAGIPVLTKECPIDKLDEPILLIVEDNKDVQNYVKNIFSDCFKVITADDGTEGIQKIQNYIPDIIICDVMIPGIDGIALCNGLKSCLKTNHIPIIMLTAKVGDENKIKGLSVGADDYIEKPFNEDLLKLKVKNLIQSRKIIRDKIINDLSYVINIPDNIPDNDQAFLKHLKQVVEAHITNPEFTADKFSKLMNMSRMQLHRKLKALTGFSTSKFILSQRLKIAAKMLVNKEVNISEIAYQVGFSDPSYFNRCFKKQFGKTPSEFKKK